MSALMSGANGIDRISPARRPADSAIGYHRWSNLLFLHWRVPAGDLARLIPRGLTLDTWEGDAFVGLVAFQLSGVRPWWFPAVPGISAFCETNVRTYVHRENRDPGVWFFSLDAASSLAVRVARRKWSLPYFRADMELRREGCEIQYHSRRRWPGPAGPGCTIDATLGGNWPRGTVDSGSAPSALPGTLEHFLVERYILYTQAAGGALRMGRVHHRPYALRQIRINRIEESLLGAAGLAAVGSPYHAVYSDHVDVDIFPLQAVEQRPVEEVPCPFGKESG